MKTLFLLLSIAATIVCTGQNVGPKITGNFDGTGKQIVVHTYAKPEGGSLVASFDGGLPSIVAGAGNLMYVNEGDLLGIGRDCISVITIPPHGCYYNQAAYCFENGAWKELVSFTIQKCDGLKPDDLKGRVQRTAKGAIVYINTDGNRTYPKRN